MPVADPTDACTEGEFYELLVDDFENEFYETEIARRFALMSQPIHQIADSNVSGVLILKQGIINQGGPADIFLRRLQVPDDVEWQTCELDGDTTTTERCLPEGFNPYAYENMVCDEWAYQDGLNPRYVEGLCLSAPMNVSGTTIVTCDSGSGNDACAATFPWEGGTQDFPKVDEWRNCDGLSSIVGCEGDSDLDDQSWENPFDVAKGHRGFIDGDFIMMMYAWSPNWKANSVGNDHYNLYVRRSFDGGLTWTTLPADFAAELPDGVTVVADGTTTCEWYGLGGDAVEACTTYGPGEFEQARNVSQLVGNKITVLDPRYTPSAGLKMLPISDLKAIGFTGYDDDVRDPSKFFVVYETGDNTTVAEGEAVPLDLFYSRAYDFGDEYDYVEYYKDKDGDGAAELVEEWDWLENQADDLSGEASVTANPGATFFYSVWNQWQEPEEEVIENSDIIFRRVMYLDDVTAVDAAPIASILYVSSTYADDDEEVILVGSARDGDHIDGLPYEDIAEVVWTLNDEVVGTEATLRMPPGNMHPGWQHFQFKASDKGGRWSPGAEVLIYIVEELSKIFLPIAIR
jgi:hypothetical protein